MGIKPDVEIDRKMVFVLTPFNPEYEADYAEIKRAIHELGFVCMHGDEDYRASQLLPFILEQMSRARLVIANISGRNANVLYEMGIAHAIGKQVVMVARFGEPLPFDIADTRVFAYENLDELDASLRKWIVHSLAD